MINLFYKYNKKYLNKKFYLIKNYIIFVLNKKLLL
jgi:hypothetical protein